MATDWYAEVAKPMEHTTSQGTSSKSVDWWAESQPTTFQEQVQTSPDTAGIGTSMRAGMIEDPKAKMAAYANARFPDDPNAASRYGIIDGDIVYRADDGQVYRENGIVGNVSEFVGREALPAVGAVAGTVAGPYGWLGSAGMAALGGAGGRAAQKLGGLAQGDQQSAGGNVLDIGLEGVLAWASAKVGEVLGKKIANRRVARDLPKLNDADTQRLVQTAQGYGIQLTPAEATNLGSLIQRQTALGQGFDQASDTMRRFYGDRAEAVTRAVNDYLGQTPGAYEAGIHGQKAASGIIRQAVDERRAASKPLYDAAINDDTLTVPREMMAQFQNDPVMRDVFSKVRSEGLYVTEGMPDNSLAVIDAAKKQLDDMIGAAGRAGETGRAAALQQRKQVLLDIVDPMFPEYASAREAFAGHSPAVDALKDSRIGAVAGLEGEKLQNAAQMLIGGRSDPSRVAWARAQFEKAGKLDTWNTLTRQWLRDSFEKTRGTLQAGDATAGPKWRNAVFGSQRDRDVLAAAMGKDDFKALSNLMDVLEAVGRVPKQQSITAFAMEDAKRMAVEAAPGKTALRNVDISSPMAELRELLISRDLDAWRQTLAEAITSPNGVDELKKLRVLQGLNPRSEKAIQIATGFLGRALSLGGAAVVGPTPPDSIPQTRQPAQAR